MKKSYGTREFSMANKNPSNQVNQVRRVLDHLYDESISLCEFSFLIHHDNAPYSRMSDCCEKLHSICCKIIITRNMITQLSGKAITHFSERSKVLSGVNLSISLGSVSLHQILQALRLEQHLVPALEYSLFLPLANGCCLQIQGSPIYNLLNSQSSILQHEVGPVRMNIHMHNEHKLDLSTSLQFGNAAARSEPHSPKDVSTILTTHKSSEELFSTSATLCDSVIAISSESVSPPTTHASSNTNSSVNQSSVTLQDKPSPISLSLEHQLSVIKDSVIVINSEIDTTSVIQQYSSSLESSNSSSSDDIEFLSNSKYHRRKQRHGKRDNSASRSQLKWKHRKRKCKHRRRKPIKKQKQSRKRENIITISKRRMLYAVTTKSVYNMLNKYNPTAEHAKQLVAEIFNSSQKSIVCSGQIPLASPIKAVSQIHPRLLTAVPLVQRLIHNHKHKVAYGSILNHYCPLPEGVQGIEQGGGVLELPALVKLHLSQRQVWRFMWSVLNHLVPVGLWGSVHNKLVFYNNLRRFIQLHRWETLTVKQMCHGIKYSHCEWLKLCPPKHKGRPHPPQPHLFERFIRWLMDEVIVRTLKVFYITEHSEHQNCLFYYRKEVWSRIERLALQVIPYRNIPLEEVQRYFHFHQSLGVSKLRFLPKTNGVRPIVNFGSKVRVPGCPQMLETVNSQLCDLFHVLNYEKSSRPWTVGSSCFGLNDVFNKLKNFAAQQKTLNLRDERPLFFVRVDISSCYDSMLPEKVLDVISSVLSQKCYILRRYMKIFVAQNKIRCVFLRAATSKKNCPSFFDFAQQQSRTVSNCIYVDQGHHLEITRQKCQELLQKFLFANLVKLGRNYYKQVKGIAHGATLSTLLCGFYYADMEHFCLSKVDPSKSLLMRYVDDFLLITREVGAAKEFLTTMQRGIPEYNCTINSSKTATNFRLTEEGEIEHLHDMEFIRWCGLLINTKTLDIMGDFSKYTSKNIKDSMTVALHGKHFSFLKSFSKKIVRLKCLPVLLDSQLVSDKTALTNIYQGFLIASYKYIMLLMSMPKGNKMAYPCKHGGFTRKELLYFFRSAVQMFSYFWLMAKNKKVRNPLLNEKVCVWLGCQALRKVLTQHQPHKLLFLRQLLSHRIESLSHILGADLLKKLFSATRKSRSKYIFTVQL